MGWRTVMEWTSRIRRWLVGPSTRSGILGYRLMARLRMALAADGAICLLSLDSIPTVRSIITLEGMDTWSFQYIPTDTLTTRLHSSQNSCRMGTYWSAVPQLSGTGTRVLRAWHN